MLTEFSFQLFPGCGKKKRNDYRRHFIEDLEERILLNCDFPMWIAQGPGPTLDGQTENVDIPGNNPVLPGAPENPVVGAIHTVVTHPTNQDTLYVGSVNGGIWRTDTASFGSDNIDNDVDGSVDEGGEIVWRPLTDRLPSLSIGALEFDPTDATFNTLVAGIGRFSAFGSAGGPLTGLLRTTDGGATWDQLGTNNAATAGTPGGLAGANISGVGPRGNVILVAANNLLGPQTQGVYRSVDGGTTFNLISGTGVLPTGPAFDMAADPGNLNRFYVGIGGAAGGIFRTDDAGQNWVNVTDVAIGALIGGNTTNIELSVSAAGNNPSYLGIVNNGQLAGVFRSANLGTAWVAMDVPQTNEGGTSVGIQPRPKPGTQGARHFSIAADPGNANVVHVGGDTQPLGPGPDGILGTADDAFPNSIGANDFSGRLFRGDANVAPTGTAPSPQWTALSHSGTGANSSPHADSRDIAFDATGDLIEVDDGGIYRRTAPQGNNGDWLSLIGNLQVTEFHDVAWDSNSNVIIGGAQDTGTPQQTSSGSRLWTSVTTADGGDVAVDPFTLGGAGQSIRYSSTQNLGIGFTSVFGREVYDQNNTQIGGRVGLIPVTGLPNFAPNFVSPVAVNSISPTPAQLAAGQSTRVVVGGSGASPFYESNNAGTAANSAATNWNPIPVAPGFGAVSANALTYGGTQGGLDNPDVLYAASGNRILLRTTAGGTLNPTVTLPAGAGTITDVIMDPNDWTTAYGTDGNQVFMTPDAGASWTDITGNLVDSTLQALEFIPLPGADALIAGGAGGVFRMLSGFPGLWSELGVDLPNAPVWDLDYGQNDDVLVAGTLGRGAWILSNASSGAADLGDAFEINDSIELASVLGSQAQVTLRDLSIHTNSDVDYFKITANATGKLLVNAFFTRGDGDLDLEIRDANDNIVASSISLTNGEQLVIPVVSQEVYFVRIAGEGEATNCYDLEIENFAAPVPDFVDLPAKDREDVLNDTGMGVFDDVTSRSQPEILIEADLDDFANMGITVLSAAQAQAMDTPGAAVQVFVNGNSVGFANPITGTGNTLFRYTFAPGQLPTNVFPADSQGWLHYVKAAVQIIDGQRDVNNDPDPAKGRTQLSTPLVLRVDEVAPAGSVPDLLDSSDSGWFANDNVTNIMTPAFQGTAEHNAKVRLFARDVTVTAAPGPWELVGQGVAGSDLTENGFNQVGSWEITVEPLDDHANQSPGHAASYEIRAEIEDLAGNISVTDALPIWIDTFAPNTPYLDLVAASDFGRNNDDNITNVNQPTFTVTADDTPTGNGNAPPNDILYRIFDRPDPGQFGGTPNNGEFLVTASAPFNANGFFTVDFAVIGYALLDGVHNLKLEIEDRAGNVSPDFLLDVLVDTQAYAGVGDLHPDSDTGIWGFRLTMNDYITSDTTPAFFGTAEANNLVYVLIDDVPAGTAVAVPLDGDDAFQPPNAPFDNIVEGNWQVQTNLNLEDGQHEAVFTFEDPAGNRVTTEEPILFFVDTEGPVITNVIMGDISIDGIFDEYTVGDVRQSLFEPKPSNRPDPLISSIVVQFRDGPNRPAAFEYDAVFQALATEEGNYRVVGDASGHIPILDIERIPQPLVAVGLPATAQYELIFHRPGGNGLVLDNDDEGAPLPDDRIALWVSDSIADPAGNPLDGESGAQAPFEGAAPPVSGSVNFPDDTNIFPTGDGEHGGDFQGRFTVDSRAEIGVWAAGNVWVDTNGNFRFDPDNNDATNRDIVYTQGFTSDDVFAGNFAGPDGVADGFDKLAAYGRVNGAFRWLIDTNNDGDPDLNFVNPLRTNGLPAAGDFDAGTAGDELAIFTGGTNPTWHFHDLNGFPFLPPVTVPGMIGYPIVGDFDGDMADDLGTYADDIFQIDVAANGFGAIDFEFRFGFIGVRERPVAGDMNGDGIDDIGLWVPDRAGVFPREAGEWYILLSGSTSGFADPTADDVEETRSVVERTVSVLDRITDLQVSPLVQPRDPGQVVEFSPVPFGRDIYAQFGDEFALPVVGNFDPPVASASTAAAQADQGLTNPINPLDVNDDGNVSPIDALLVIHVLGDVGQTPLPSGVISGPPYYDVNGDGEISPLDPLLVVNYLSQVAPTGQTAQLLAEDVRLAMGDANEDGIFDQLDLVEVLRAGKFGTREPVSWHQGDWNGDGVFDQLDLVEALRSGTYLQRGQPALTSEVAIAMSVEESSARELREIDLLFEQLGTEIADALLL